MAIYRRNALLTIEWIDAQLFPLFQRHFEGVFFGTQNAQIFEANVCAISAYFVIGGDHTAVLFAILVFNTVRMRSANKV